MIIGASRIASANCQPDAMPIAPRIAIGRMIASR
jgi:hypothetical protein